MQSGKYRSVALNLLIGYSLGGFVALEIAQRLVVAGEKVALSVVRLLSTKEQSFPCAAHALIFSPNKAPCEGHD